MAKKTLYTENQVERIVNFVCGLDVADFDIDIIRVLASLSDFEHFNTMREFVSEKRRAK
jgi:glutaredoxin-related protein